MLQLSGPFEISQRSFQSQTGLENAGIYVLFGNSLSSPLAADWVPRIVDGIVERIKSLPSATHFCYQVCTAQCADAELGEARRKFGLRS